MSDYHIPVLLNESVDGLNINPAGIYVDATFGGGGHSSAILEKLTTGRLFSFDQDSDAKNNTPDHPCFTFVQSNFRYMENFLKLHGIRQIDGILADFGISSHHIDVAERGFAFRKEAPLDMRMNQSANLTAASILNKYTEPELVRIFRQYGEITNAKPLVARIMAFRESAKLEQNTQLLEAVKGLYPMRKENQFLAKLFQALRIEVNDEMGALEDFLEQTPHILKPGGRLSLITYHSLEDRPVKNFIKNGSKYTEQVPDLYGNRNVPFEAITRKPITPSEEEIERNNRARSAKLRIAERVINN